MKIFLLLGMYLSTTALAWSGPSSDVLLSRHLATRRKSSALCGSADENGVKDDQERMVGRRRFLRWASIASLAMAPQVATSHVSQAKVLGEFHSDKAKVRPHSMYNNNQMVTSTTLVGASSSSNKLGPPSQHVEIDPSLRASYYYPTAKKRYLPRIQKVSSAIGGCKNALLIEDWDTVTVFAKTAEDAILPLQLYASSLGGQGLSQSTNFAKVMRQDALDYEKAYKTFDQALRMRDSPTALRAVSDMDVAVSDYRNAGRLQDDAGNIPSIDEIKSMTAGRGKFVA